MLLARVADPTEAKSETKGKREDQAKSRVNNTMQGLHDTGYDVREEDQHDILRYCAKEPKKEGYEQRKKGAKVSRE